jgi:hypothetical protein
MDGKKNIVVGLFAMAGFMAYGFLLIYLRDFAPNATEWAASYGNGKHFEARLAHVFDSDELTHPVRRVDPPDGDRTAV